MINISELYGDLIETDYPNRPDDWPRFINPTSNEIALIKKYQDYFDSSQIDKATELLNQNPILKRMIIDAQTMNQTRDAIIALQRFYLNDVQNYLVNIVKPKGDFKLTSSYTKYDLVYYESNYVKKPYMANEVSIPVGTLPTNTDYFVPLAIQGQDGVGLKFKGLYDVEIPYYKEDCVSYNDTLWFAKVDNTNEIPSESSNVWGIVFRNFQSKDPSVVIGTIEHDLGHYPDCRLYRCEQPAGIGGAGLGGASGNLISIPAEFELDGFERVIIKTIVEFSEHTEIDMVSPTMFCFSNPNSIIGLILILR